MQRLTTLLCYMARLTSTGQHTVPRQQHHLTVTLTWEARSARSSSATMAEGCPRDCTPSRHRRSATSRCCGIAVLSDDSPAVSAIDSSVGCAIQHATWRPL